MVATRQLLCRSYTCDFVFREHGGRQLRHGIRKWFAWAAMHELRKGGLETL